MLAPGAETYPGGDPGVFNMAVMGMRLAQRVNGVSQAARRGEPGHVRGPVAGVRHQRGADRLDHQRRAHADLGRAGGRLLAPGELSPQAAGAEGDWDRAATAPAAEIWAARHALRARLVAETRRRLRASWQQRGASEAELTWTDDVLDDNVLTIGFARRVPSYKRLTLMLNDPVQLSRC